MIGMPQFKEYTNGVAIARKQSPDITMKRPPTWIFPLEQLEINNKSPRLACFFSLDFGETYSMGAEQTHMSIGICARDAILSQQVCSESMLLILANLTFRPRNHRTNAEEYRNICEPSLIVFQS